MAIAEDSVINNAPKISLGHNAEDQGDAMTIVCNHGPHHPGTEPAVPKSRSSKAADKSMLPVSLFSVE